jgi:hypothetical protein
VAHILKQFYLSRNPFPVLGPSKKQVCSFEPHLYFRNYEYSDHQCGTLRSHWNLMMKMVRRGKITSHHPSENHLYRCLDLRPRSCDLLHHQHIFWKHINFQNINLSIRYLSNDELT